MNYFIVTGEPSGDALGAKLLAALRARDPEAVFAGVGGEAMARAGFASLFPLADISVMGILPVLRRLPTVLRRIDETARAVVASRPDVLVLIDSPDFTHRVAKKARKALPDLKVVDYVSPTVWAWRPGRAKKMRKIIDLVLAVLPFEPAAHQRLGGPKCIYVGHSLVERVEDLHGDESARANGPVLVLPGSRRSVVARMGPAFRDALARLKALRPELEFVLPVAGPVEAVVRAEVARWPVQPRIVVGEAERYAAFRGAGAALAASGTVTLELALSGTPTIVAYKVPKLEEFIGRRLIQVPTIVLPNLILGENAFPEYLQDEADGQTLARAVAALLDDGPERRRQVEALAKLSDKMLLPGGQTPSGAAADAIIALAGGGKPPQAG
ncbi:lipid-A-disaccharide synthase [Rhodoblastus acidophilus]|uniref:Lipid-A-disaccharide synthase n=1 Tax=Rhodoblastus acidophilus TaxID=1074 RepID=A0A212RF36_RHOAC|nr:lipid-A-disaccharide synthase [Rhodoblastus acidophilus]PPQ39682.1 lipid-A-disaccharide synthase [Rhodoblastus acidophilus]RAI24464.1 lipid-A-disaccharide synthase [Rhodoblastus acidophilus]SNB70976.1 lipid-A-disaccharide synthase [Rhodoblastus acidophilus]